MPIEPPETVIVTEKVVACDGGGALGHPRVWLNMGDDGRVDCPYCDREFLLAGGPAERERREKSEAASSEEAGDAA